MKKFLKISYNCRIHSNPMRIYISYHPSDIDMRKQLNTYLTVLEREKIVSTYKEHLIGTSEEAEDIFIADNLPELFLVLLSPDYLASDYLKDKRLQKALKKAKEGSLILISIILAPCNWRNTVFEDLHILPKNNKPIAVLENKNLAFVDVIWNIKEIISCYSAFDTTTEITFISPDESIHDIDRDLASLGPVKIDFIEKSFKEIKEYIKEYMQKTLHALCIEAEIQNDTITSFDCLIVNRHTTAESMLKINLFSENLITHIIHSFQLQLRSSVEEKELSTTMKFILSQDDHSLFWILNKNFPDFKIMIDIPLRK